MPRPDQIRELQDTWDELGRKDPMWAIATNKDEWDEQEFFATGSAEIEAVLAYVAGLRPDLAHRRAMDFGCGLGRLTRALAGHFEETVGVDIAPSMVAAASELNRELDNVSFVVNDRPGLDPFPSRSFDLVYSNITLQHMRPELARGYIEAFMRIVSGQGLVLFQLPSREWPEEAGMVPRLRRVLRRGPRGAVRTLTRRVSQPAMEMHCIARDEVVAILDGAGAEVVDVRPNENAGSVYESYSYAAVPRRGEA